MKFKILEDEKEIICESILTFKDESNDINYIVYSEENDDNIYASRYIVENNSIVLQPIENDSEWNMIDNMLERCGE